SSPARSFSPPSHPPAPHSFPTRRSSDLRRGDRFIDLGDPRSAGLRPRQGTQPLDVPHPRRALVQRLSLAPSLRAAARSVLVQLRSEEHTSELQSRFDLVCRLLLENKHTK